jgi:hypothetical protein
MAGDFDRIQRNVQSMIGQSAPVKDIDGYLNTEGYTPDSFKAQVTTGPERGTEEPYSGTILPFTKDEGGDISFDPDAGIVGAFKRAATLPGDVYTGEVDPMSEEGTERALEAAGVMTPMGAASRVSPRFGVKTTTPSREEIKTATKAGYDATEASGVGFTVMAAKKWSDDITSELTSKGVFSHGRFKEVHDIITKSLKLSGDDLGPGDVAYITPSAIDEMRKSLSILGQSAAKQGDDALGRAANIAMGKLERLLNDVSPESIAIGNHRLAEDAMKSLKGARADAAAGFRSDVVTGVEDAVTLSTAATNSGRNFDNKTRQRLASLLTSGNGAKVRGFFPEEQEAIRNIVMGRWSKNTARRIGNWFGGGGGMGQSILPILSGSAGFAATGGSTAATVAAAITPVMIGALGRAIANTMTRKELVRLDKMVRARSAVSAATRYKRSTYKPSPMKDYIMKGLVSPKPNETERRRAIKSEYRRLTDPTL